MFLLTDLPSAFITEMWEEPLLWSDFVDCSDFADLFEVWKVSWTNFWDWRVFGFFVEILSILRQNKIFLIQFLSVFLHSAQSLKSLKNHLSKP